MVQAQHRRLPRWRRYVNRLLAAEISTVTRHCGGVVQWEPRAEDPGLLLSGIAASRKSIATRVEELREATAATDGPTVVLLNGNLNFHYDIQRLLEEIGTTLDRGDRIIAVVYNSYLRALYVLANRLGIRQGELPTTFITETALRNLAVLAGYEVVRMRPTAYVPWSLFGLGTLTNRLLPTVPLVRRLGFAALIVLRPVRPSRRTPSVSIIVPARNERDNIEPLLSRIPDLGTPVEIVFIEGGSTDGTWEEIQAAVSRWASRYELKAERQLGTGKADAVRLGMRRARGELLVILDADLSVPPELLPRFLSAYGSGLADFVNGTRLVYPMENEAMRFLNRLGNLFFARAVSWVADARLGDVLCGTKLFSRRDYARMVAWRESFGDFDPFGDFELLYPAAVLGLGIVDVPVRYRARTYGQTNIQRFRHGWLLLRMVAIGWLRIKLGRA
jgi:hypothetical protein